MALPTISEREAQRLLDEAKAAYDMEREAIRAQEKAFRDSLKEAKLPDTLYNPIVWDELQQVRYDEYQRRSDKIREIQRRLKGVQLTVRETAPAWPIIYGRVRTGGALSFVCLDEPVGGDQWLNLGFTLAGHEIDSVQKVFINGEEVEWEDDITTEVNSWGAAGTKWDGQIFISVRTLGDQTEVNWDLWDQSNNAHGDIPPLFPGKWTSQHIQQGRAFVYLKLWFDNEVFAEGWPKIVFEVKGNNQIYDPRTDTTGYSANAALVIAHHITNSVYGAQADRDDEIDEDNISDQADICDEDVTLADGSTEKRYEVNGVLFTDMTRRQQLVQLLTSCAGYIARVGAKRLLNVAAWPATAGDLALTEDDIIGGLDVSLMPDHENRYNGVKGQFVSAAEGYVLKEFPPVTNAFYLAEDQGSENNLDILLPVTTTASAAQRLAKIDLERNRQGIIVKATFKLRALSARVGDVVKLTHASYGWSEKYFEVRVCKLVFGGFDNAGVVVAMELLETAEGITEWDAGEETESDLAPDTNLPSPSTISKPSGVTCDSSSDHLLQMSDGSVRSRIYVEWNQSTDPFVRNGGYVEIKKKKSAGAAWFYETPVPGDSTYSYVDNVVDGVLYDVGVRFRNVLNVVSEFTVVNSHLVLGKSAAPSDVLNLRATLQQNGNLIQWNAIADADLKEYVLKVGGTGWSDATELYRGKATSFLWTHQTAGSYTLRVKAVDMSNNESTNETTLLFVVRAPATPTVTLTLNGAHITLAWSDATTDYPLDEYIVSYGAAAGENEIARIKSRSYTFRANWSGQRTFYVQGKDIADNVGAGGGRRYTIVSPGPVVSLTPSVMDNNVFLKWSAPTSGTLPIEEYEIYRGDDESSWELVGTQKGTFAAIVELVADTYTYWVRAKDTAVNTGTARPATAVVLQPPDYVLRTDSQLEPHYAKRAGVLAGKDSLRFVARFSSASSEYLSIADNSALSIGADQDFTVCARFCPTLDSDQQVVVSKYAASSSTGGEYELGIDGDDKLYFSAVGSNVKSTITASAALTDEEWVTAFGWYDHSEQTIYLQYDDVGATNTSHTANINNSSTAFSIGRSEASGGSAYFDGDVAFSALWKRVLTSVERQKLIDIGSALERAAFDSGLEEDCVGAWDLSEESDGSEAVSREDLIGANDLTDYNTTASGVDDSDYTRSFDLELGEIVAPVVLGESWEEHFRRFVEERVSPTIHLRADTGVTYDGSNRISQINDQSGNARHITQATDAKKLTLTTINNRQAALSDGTDDYMTAGAVTLGDIINADACHFFWCIKPTNFAANRWYFTDSSYRCIFNQVAATTALRFYHDDGGADYIDRTGLSAETVYVVEGKHESGTIYLRVNGGSWVSKASGNTASLAGTLRFFSDNSSNPFLGAFGEMFGFDAVQTETNAGLINKLLASWWGGAGAKLTLQDLIDAGYNYLPQPTTTETCYIERVVDLGAVISSAIITTSWLEEVIAGSTSVTVDIATSLDGETFTDYTSSNSLFAVNFRAVKVKLTFIGSDLTSLSRCRSMRLRLDVKRTKDNGQAQASSSDYYGSFVEFDQNYLDVERISVTPAATARAAHFVAGNSEYLSAADHADFTPKNTDFTIAGWVKFDTANVGHVLWSKYNANSDRREYRCYVYQQTSWYAIGANVLRWSVSTDGTSGGLVNCTDDVLGQIPAGEWVFVACQHDYTNSKLRLKINNLPWTEVSHGGNLYDGTADFRLGADDLSATNDNYFRGLQRNVGIWHEAFSQDQLNALYAWGLCDYSEFDPDLETVVTFSAASSEYLSIADNAALSITSDITLAGWFRPTTLGSVNRACIGKWSSASNQKSYILYFDTSSNPTFGLSSDGSTTDGIVQASSFGAVEEDKWYFVVGRYDGARAYLSINGVTDSSAYASGIYNGTADFQLGRQGVTGYYFDGNASKVAVWNRAISDEEMMQLYNNARGLPFLLWTTGLKSDLVSYWPLDEASGTRGDGYGANDLTDNNTCGSTSLTIHPFSENLKVFYQLDEESGSRSDDKGSHTLTDNNTVTSRVLDVTGHHNFEDVANPTGFYELLFTGGIRISLNAAWQSEGFVNAIT